MNSFEYRAPTSLAEVHAALAAFGEDARLIAGGTALINLMKEGLVRPSALVALRGVPELQGLSAANGGLRLGGGLTHTALERSPEVQQRYRLIGQALRRLATVRVRNVATVGGALCHADPNQDLPVALLALDARVVLQGARGRREVALGDFFKDYYETDLQPGEVLTDVLLPDWSGARAAFVKFTPRTADDYATVSAAAVLRVDAGNVCRDVRLALGSVGPTTIRARGAEEALRGQALTPERLREAGERAREEVAPLDDVRGSAAYKRRMAGVFARRALEQALAG